MLMKYAKNRHGGKIKIIPSVLNRPNLRTESKAKSSNNKNQIDKPNESTPPNTVALEKQVVTPLNIKGIKAQPVTK